MSGAIDTAGLTPELLTRYDRPGPRYTSYPTAPHFSSEFDESTYRECLKKAAARTEEPLSMYVHLPFCEERCTFCGCNVVISPRRGPEEPYLGALALEIQQLGSALGRRRRLNQLHWGGGTPTYLSPEQCVRLFESITSIFEITADAEIALEIDPCVTTHDHLATLRSLGFNRLSMGVQDLDSAVQHAIKRIQPLELTKDQVVEARRLGFESVNIDLVYGLPGQDEEQFRRTVRTVIAELEPDRVACFSYAHVPWIKPHQKELETSAMPSGWEKFRIFAAAAEEFTSAGYRFVGFDHFARPDDELAAALSDHRVHRNFMGYTVMPATDQVGVGVTSIGDVGGAYAANQKKLAAYNRSVADDHLPVERGLVRTPEDEVRRAVINRIICSLELDFGWLETTWAIDARTYFARELDALKPLRDDGLVAMDDSGLEVSPSGRFFLRNICMPFDTYLVADGQGPHYSRTV